MASADDSVIIVREEERGFAAAGHLVNAVPFWGFIFLMGIWLYFKERSREVIFHVQQAVVFQMVFLCVGVFTLALEILFRVVSVVHEGIGTFLSHANVFFFMTAYTIYAAVCIWAAVTTWMGRPFLYPYIGRRVLEGNLTKR